MKIWKGCGNGSAWVLLSIWMLIDPHILVVKSLYNKSYTAF